FFKAFQIFHFKDTRYARGRRGAGSHRNLMLRRLETQRNPRLRANLSTLAHRCTTCPIRVCSLVSRQIENRSANYVSQHGSQYDGHYHPAATTKHSHRRLEPSGTSIEKRRVEGIGSC